MDIEAAKTLWRSDDGDTWQNALDEYPQVLKEFAKTAPRRKDLPELHRWLEDDLMPRLQKDRYLTKEDLSRLMKFKLARGKFRPRLQQFIDSLSDSEVKRVTKEAAEILPPTKPPKDTECDSALEKLTSLKGIGPAFASLLLSLFTEHLSFMGDELLLTTGERVYDKKRLKQLNSQVQDKARKLKQKFSCRQLEMAIFSEANKSAKSGQKDNSKSPSSTRKRSNDSTPSSTTKSQREK